METTSMNGNSAGVATTGAGATAAQPSGNVGQYGSNRSASLYVGDLSTNTTESQLFEAFSQIGKIQSIRILRDAITRQSLGYAYVNYYDYMDAERAIDVLNFSQINSRQCRVMWVQRDPYLRRTGIGNVVIKNLDKDIDNKSLYDTFSQFGNILSCKVVQDEEGNSKGFGFVHFDSEAAATECISKVNGATIKDKAVTVEPFKRGHKNDAQWTNLYVKNCPSDWDNDKLLEIFRPYGEITSGVVRMYEGEEAKEKGLEGKNKGFGFVNYAEHESAVKAMEELHGKVFMEGDVERELYVRRLQTKKERQRELRDKHASIKKERLTKFQGCNLYIKNLDESINDEWLRTNFGKHGTITSARVMKDQATGQSKGFGFVCFSTPEEASQAIQKMNGKMISSKPIYVALSQVASQRREMLVSFHQQGQQRGMIPPMQGAPFYPSPPVLQQPAYLGPIYGGGPMGSRPGMMPQRGGMPMNPGFNPAGVMRPMYRMPDYRRGGDPMGMEGPGGRQGKFGRGSQGRQRPGRMGMQQQGGPGMQGMSQQQEPQQGPVPPQPAYNQEQQQQPAVDTRPQGGQIDPNRLASASEAEQKSILGEQLYPLIFGQEPNLAGKITGMILELDNTEILHLLESPDSLTEKIQEAIKVLQDYQQQPSRETE